MFRLLLATRLRYYRNFMRAHFDRVTLLELGGIFLILFFLTLRSPADIGYRLDFLTASDFPQKWANLWAAILPLFYLIAEVFGLITLRPTGEAQLLGTLPVARKAILPYHLLRHFIKTFGLIFFGAVFFMLGKNSVAERLLAAGTALVFMLALQLLAFVQAYVLRRQSIAIPPLRGNDLMRWLFVEGIALIILFSAQEPLNLHAQDFFWAMSKLLLALAVLIGLGIFARRIYDPARLIEAPPLFDSKAWHRQQVARLSSVSTEESREQLKASPALGYFPALEKFSRKNFITAQIKRDLLFLKRQKPSLLYLCGGALALLTLASWTQAQAVLAYSSVVFIHFIYCAMMINALMIIFEHDGPVFGLLRALPISAVHFWRARWLLVAGMLVLPMLLPAFILAAKFGVTEHLALFLLATWLILPASFALMMCNAAFSMFPHAKYAGILMNVFALLMILFWFYMPLGTVILLGFTLTRVRKSQRHFQNLEVN